MALSNTKLRSIYNKPYSGSAEPTDGDELRVRISQKGGITFQFRYRGSGKAQRITIGHYAALSLREVRISIDALRIPCDNGIFIT